MILSNLFKNRKVKYQEKLPTTFIGLSAFYRKKCEGEYTCALMLGYSRDDALYFLSDIDTKEIFVIRKDGLTTKKCDKQLSKDEKGEYYKEFEEWNQYRYKPVKIITKKPATFFVKKILGKQKQSSLDFIGSSIIVRKPCFDNIIRVLILDYDESKQMFVLADFDTKEIYLAKSKEFMVEKHADQPPVGFDKTEYYKKLEEWKKNN